MRKHFVFIFILSMLATDMDCFAQTMQGSKVFRAIRNRGIPAGIIIGNGISDAMKYHSYLKPSPYQNHYTNAGNQYSVVPPPPAISKPRNLYDSLLLSLSKKNFPITKRPTPSELKEAMWKKEKKQLQKEYQELCTEIVQGTLHDTLDLVRVGNKAQYLKHHLKQDSTALSHITTNCFKQFIICRPSTSKIAAAVDSLMKSTQAIAPRLIDEDIEYRFCKYWMEDGCMNPGSFDFETLAKLGERYNCSKTHIAQGMLPYFEAEYLEASDLFEKAVLTVLVQSQQYDFISGAWYDEALLEQSGNYFLLFNVTALCMDLAQRYSDMLSLFGSKELEWHVAKNQYIAFLLYKAALITDVDKAEKYRDMGMAANEEYFMEQFREFYTVIYKDFINNPQPSINLDFLSAGLDSTALSQLYINLACDISDKLPDAEDEEKEYYFDEMYSPYRDALLEISHRSDSLHNGRLTINNAYVKIIAESARMGFLSSAEQGRANLKIIYEQLYNKRNTPEYYSVIIGSGINYSVGLSYQNPKKAAKVVDKILPVIKKLEMQDYNPFGDEYMVEIYKYAEDLYRKIGKSKKAEKMQKLADEYVLVVE